MLTPGECIIADDGYIQTTPVCTHPPSRVVADGSTLWLFLPVHKPSQPVFPCVSKFPPKGGGAERTARGGRVGAGAKEGKEEPEGGKAHGGGTGKSKGKGMGQAARARPGRDPALATRSLFLGVLLDARHVVERCGCWSPLGPVATVQHSLRCGQQGVVGWGPKGRGNALDAARWAPFCNQTSQGRWPMKR